MNAIDMLKAEHRLIERTMSALESYANAIAKGEQVDSTDLGRFVGFIQRFADAYHHAKEENFLFVAMTEHGFPLRAGPIAVMLAEHDVGREHTKAMEAIAEKEGAWSDDDRRTIVENALGFVGMLRAHILKEDGILYPMASTRLPEGVMEAVTADCVRHEQEREADGQKAELHALAEALAGRYL